MAGSIRESLESAVNEAETTVPEAVAAVETSSEAPATNIEEASAVGGDEGESPADSVPEAAAAEKAPNDADKKPAPTAEKAPNDADKKPAPTAEEVAEQKRLHRIDRAPQSWKKEAKGEWANLPLHIRQEVHKREAEITRALNQSAPDRQLAEQFKQTVTPYMARIQANGVNPLQAVEGLLKADYILASAPKLDRAKYMADLIKQYDVDVVALDAALVGQAPPQSQQSGPDINAIVQQQLQQALAPIIQREQQQMQRKQQEMAQTIEDMAYDPKYPYFDEVRQDMADIMEISYRRGVAVTLDEAYNKAVRMSNDLNAQIERQATMSNANQQHQQALRAKAAASSVTGAPASGGDQRLVGDGSLRGAIEAAYGGQRL
jgi:hypothetical protein